MQHFPPCLAWLTISKHDSSPWCYSSCLICLVSMAMKVTSSAPPSAAWTLWSRCRTAAGSRTWSTLHRTSTFCNIWALRDRLTRTSQTQQQRTWWKVEQGQGSGPINPLNCTYWSLQIDINHLNLWNIFEIDFTNEASLLPLVDYSGCDYNHWLLI